MGAAGALVGVVIVMLIADAISSEYEVSPLILLPVLGTVLGLLGIEASNYLRGGGKGE